MMLTDNTKVPLVKKDDYYLYGDSLTGGFYKVFETKQLTINQNKQVIFYIIGATVIKQLDRLYLSIFSMGLNSCLLLVVMMLISLKSHQQLIEWQDEIMFEKVQILQNQVALIAKDAARSLKQNLILVVILIALWGIVSFFFLIFSSTFFLVISLVLWYVLTLIVPTIHLCKRKYFIKEKLQ